MILPEPRRPEPPAVEPRRPRSVVAYDVERRQLVVGDRTAAVPDPADREAVYAAYLSLLRAVRGAERGEVLPLRSTDVEALIALVGDDPRSVEDRLVELMGCTQDEAELIGRVLVRHRVFAGAAGLAAVLSLVALPAGASTPARAGDAPSSARPAAVAQALAPAPPVAAAPSPDGSAAPAPSTPAAPDAAPAPAAPTAAAAHLPAPRASSEELPAERGLVDAPDAAEPLADVPAGVPVVDVPVDASLPTGVDLSDDIDLDTATDPHTDAGADTDPGLDVGDAADQVAAPVSGTSTVGPEVTAFWPFLPDGDSAADAA